AFRRADFSAVASMLGGADYHWLLWYPVLGVALNVVRSEIWRLLLRGRAGRVDAFWAYGTGFLVNNVLPLRVGEAARVGLLAARGGPPLLGAAAAAGLERALDIVWVIAIVAASLPVDGVSPDVRRAFLAVRTTAALGIAAIACVIVAGDRMTG